MTRGRFIVIEGVDGSGKSTQARLLAHALTDRGYNVKLTAEPTRDGPIGERLLRPALTGQISIADPRAMALLFIADRFDHCAREIVPHLAAGSVVICDRYTLSTLVYQGLALRRILGDQSIAWLEGVGAGTLQPDLTVVLTMPADRAIERLRARGGRRELYETEDTLRWAHAAYGNLVFGLGAEGHNATFAYADRDEATIAAEVLALVDPIIADLPRSAP